MCVASVLGRRQVDEAAIAYACLRFHRRDQPFADPESAVFAELLDQTRKGLCVLPSGIANRQIQLT